MDIFYTFIKDDEYRINHDLQHKIGRYLVNYAAKNKYGIENPEIEVVNGKPKFKYSNKKFSISHSNNLVVAAFDDKPIGVDVEYIKQRDVAGIADRMKFPLEENSLEEFYKCWTEFEAKFKLGQNTINYTSQKFMDNYMLSVASSYKVKDLNFEEVYFDVVFDEESPSGATSAC